jgi:hypothetical protein
MMAPVGEARFEGRGTFRQSVLPWLIWSLIGGVLSLLVAAALTRVPRPAEPPIANYDHVIGETWVRQDRLGRSDCLIMPASYLRDGSSAQGGRKPAWAIRPVAGESVWTAAVGFPLRSLRTHDGLVQRSFQGVQPSTPSLAAYRPWWPGLISNFAIFAAAFGVGRFTLAGMMRTHRRRRSRCVCCGYDRRGLAVAAVCPECGSRDRTRAAGAAH